jgi:hypothetical protein
LVMVALFVEMFITCVAATSPSALTTLPSIVLLGSVWENPTADTKQIQQK